MRPKLMLLMVTLFGSLAPSVQAGETVTFFHNDNVGSPLVATDINGLQVWRESYRPYGERLVQQPSSQTNKLWFTGKPVDSATGLIYMGARYYDPTLGRFMAIDPLPPNPLAVHGINRYAYANNNPFRFYDPSGAQTEEVLVSGRRERPEPDWKRDEYMRLASITGTPRNTIEAKVQQAILRGDIEELKLALGEAAGQLSANEALIAQRALAAMETLTAEDSALLAGRYGVDFANKVAHIFGKNLAEHNLAGVVKELGSTAKALAEAQRAVEGAYAATGSLPATIQLGTYTVTVRAAVVNGVARISTMFIPP